MSLNEVVGHNYIDFINGYLNVNMWPWSTKETLSNNRSNMGILFCQYTIEKESSIAQLCHCVALYRYPEVE